MHQLAHHLSVVLPFCQNGFSGESSSHSLSITVYNTIDFLLTLNPCSGMHSYRSEVQSSDRLQVNNYFYVQYCEVETPGQTSTAAPQWFMALFCAPPLLSFMRDLFE
ncbi:hypothetical protein STEG23_033679, partial [Scotinomys teguina]